jgi:hypothetical protein
MRITAHAYRNGSKTMIAILADTAPQNSLDEWWRERKDGRPALATAKLEKKLRSYVDTELRWRLLTPPDLAVLITQMIDPVCIGLSCYEAMKFFSTDDVCTGTQGSTSVGTE